MCTCWKQPEFMSQLWWCHESGQMKETAASLCHPTVLFPPLCSRKFDNHLLLLWSCKHLRSALTSFTHGKPQAALFTRQLFFSVLKYVQDKCKIRMLFPCTMCKQNKSTIKCYEDMRYRHKIKYEASRKINSWRQKKSGVLGLNSDDSSFLGFFGSLFGHLIVTGF